MLVSRPRGMHDDDDDEAPLEQSAPQPAQSSD
jgi:hypothetical protein